MAEWWLPVAMALVLVGAWAVTVAVGRRRGDDRPRVPADLGPFPTVFLFTSDDCGSCPPAREAVASATSGRFVEYTWQVHPGIHGRLRIDKVPTTWVVDGDGRVAEVVEGRPEPGALARAIGRLSAPDA